MNNHIKINTYYNEEKEKELKSEFTNYLNLLLEKQTNNWTRNSINTFYDSFEKITKEDLLNKVKRKELTINDLNDQYQWFFQKFSNNEQQLLLMISCYEISEGKAFISFIELWRYFNINPIEYFGMMSKLFYSYYLTYKEIDNMQYEELEKIIKKRR